MYCITVVFVSILAICHVEAKPAEVVPDVSTKGESLNKTSAPSYNGTLVPGDVSSSLPVGGTTESVEGSTVTPGVMADTPISTTITPTAGEPTNATAKSSSEPVNPTTNSSTSPTPPITNATTVSNSTMKTDTTPLPMSTSSKPNVTSPVPFSETSTQSIPVKDRRFDGPSFIGGIVLCLGTMAIGFVAFKFYKARTERNYHTL